MGKHSNFLRGTAETLRRIADEGAKNYTAADNAVAEAEQRDARADAHQRADLAAKFPALGQR